MRYWLVDMMKGMWHKIGSFVPLYERSIIWRGLDKQSGSILDVGCGFGEPMKDINRRGGFYTVGVDIFVPWLKKCKDEGIHQDYVLCDIRRLPFQRKSFDIVLCLDMVEHVEKEEGRKLIHAVEEIARREVIIAAPIGYWAQNEMQGNPYQKHRASWLPAEFKRLGYKVRGIGWFARLCSQGLLARLPKPLRFLLWISSLPIVYFLPRLAGRQICFKNLGKG